MVWALFSVGIMSFFNQFAFTSNMTEKDKKIRET